MLEIIFLALFILALIVVAAYLCGPLILIIIFCVLFAGFLELFPVPAEKKES